MIILSGAVIISRRNLIGVRHGGLIVGITILEILLESLQLEKKCFKFTMQSTSEEGNYINDYVDASFEL